MPADELYRLLRSYDPSDVSMQWFYAAWVENLSVEDAVAVLNGDPATGAPDSFAGWGSGSDGSDDEAGGMLAGPIGGWTLVIGDYRVTEDEAVLALSRRGGRALAVCWDTGSQTQVKYAKSGELLTVLDILFTDDRSGSEPDALVPYMDGLRFDIDGEPPVEPAESFTSALTLIGRMTGRPIDREWLEATHVAYAVPAEV
uniref:DUF6461 domain-containing protein n=1 Tax=Herbidospora sakaeratensis TaxID=564415 RepID=UPI0007855515|nr:DUF6461 domain-containing protein [Herbidospora sakaeratensis]